MSLLAEIQSAAIDPAISTADFLRRCQILAARLRHEPFKAWVTAELNGYADDAELPPYRKNLTGQVRAQLVGPFGREANNVPVPLTFLPRDVAEKTQSFNFYQGVGMLEALVAGAKGIGHSVVTNPFPPELFAPLQIMDGYAIVGMWKELPITAISNILDQVKSRALAFTLDVEAEDSKAGEVPGTSLPIAAARVDAIFNTTIHGGTVAVGPRATIQVAQGDLNSLLSYLEVHGVNAAEQRELAEAIADDGKSPGSRVAAWIGKVSLRLAASGGRVLEGGGGALLAAAVARYFGLGV